MIIDHEATIKHLSSWIKRFAVDGSIKYIVVPHDQEWYPSCSLLVAALCSKAAIQSVILSEFPLELLGNTDVFTRWSNYVRTDLYNDYNVWDHAFGYVDTVDDGIVAGPICLNERYNRTYHKRKQGAADFFPIFDLYLSEVNQLLNHLGIETAELSEKDKLLEFADKQGPIITNYETPNHSHMWFQYTLPQKEAIAKLHAREKKTHHKAITSGFPKLRGNFPFIK